jgi:hypothetical protein
MAYDYEKVQVLADIAAELRTANLLALLESDDPRMSLTEDELTKIRVEIFGWLEPDPEQRRRPASQARDA